MRVKKVDSNQKKVVQQIRRLGFSVYVTSMVGKGFPDFVVGAGGKNFLFELKDEDKSESRKRLTEDEEEFFETWNGQVNKVENIDEIIALIK